MKTANQTKTTEMTKTNQKQRFTHNRLALLYIYMPHTSSKKSFCYRFHSHQLPFFLHARICLALKSVVTFTPYSHRFARAEHIVLLCVKTKNKHLNIYSIFFFSLHAGWARAPLRSSCGLLYDLPLFKKNLVKFTKINTQRKLHILRSHKSNCRADRFTPAERKTR